MSDVVERLRELGGNPWFGLVGVDQKLVLEAAAYIERLQANARPALSASGRWRKKPIVIDAYCFNQEPSNYRPDWLQDPLNRNAFVTYPDHAFIYTREGIMRVDLGDWIIRGVKGEMYPIKDE